MTTFYSHVVFAGGTSGVVDNPYGKKLFVGATPNGRGVTPAYSTIVGAIADAVAGDTIIIQRGTYTENPNFSVAGVVVRAGETNGYPDSVVIVGTTTVNASNITFIGIEFFSNSASAASVHVGPTTEADSVVFIRCSFASDGTTEPAYGLRLRGGNNLRVEGCRFVDNTRALVCHSGQTSLGVSGLTVKDCEYLENTTADFGNSAATADEPYGEYAIANLAYFDNKHMRGNATPTRIISITDGTGKGTSSGAMASNCFANATNSSSQLVIPSGILYMANMTEAGTTTARPS